MIIFYDSFETNGTEYHFFVAGKEFSVSLMCKQNTSVSKQPALPDLPSASPFPPASHL